MSKTVTTTIKKTPSRMATASRSPGRCNDRRLDETPSSKYLLYYTYYPEKGLIKLESTPYTAEQLEKEFDQQFKFEILDGVFHSFYQTAEKFQLIPDLDHIPNEDVRKPVYFHYDGLEYRGKIQMGPFWHDWYGECKSLSIRLPNDGFVYKPEQKTGLDMYHYPKKRHHARGWYELNDCEFHRFQKIMEFLANYHQSTGMKVFYNYRERSLDVCSIDSKQNLIKVCFHHYAPEKEFEDVWRKPYIPPRSQQNGQTDSN